LEGIKELRLLGQLDGLLGMLPKTQFMKDLLAESKLKLGNEPAYRSGLISGRVLGGLAYCAFVADVASTVYIFCYSYQG